MTFRWIWWIGVVGLRAVVTMEAQGAVVVGVVMDTAGRPLEAAQVLAIRKGIAATTDAGGYFRLVGLPEGREVFQVRRIGFHPQVFEVDLESGDTTRVGVTLARDSVQRLPEVGVVAPRPLSPGQALEMEAVKRALASTAPISAIITRQELDHDGSDRLHALLRRHGLRSRMDTDGRDRVGCPRGGPAAVYLDGVRMGKDFDAAGFPPRNVELVEVYRSNMARPTQYSPSGTGCSLLIWTRR